MHKIGEVFLSILYSEEVGRENNDGGGFRHCDEGNAKSWVDPYGGKTYNKKQGSRVDFLRVLSFQK